MNAQSNRISTVAENIQNSGTTGYKRASTEFSSLLIADTGTGNYNSGSVETTVRRAVSEGGTINATTSNPTSRSTATASSSSTTRRARRS